ncbi:MAG: hypothetical protein WCS52_12390 [bacterium]|jgi:hypothetical protein
MFSAKTIAKAVRRANIVYDLHELQTGHEFIPPYVANGWVGGSFDEFGFPSKPNFDYDHGRRHIGYVNHYYRYSNGGHNQAALLAMSPGRADGRGLWLGDLSRYRQVLDLYAMTLTTDWTVDTATYRTRSFASMALPELFETAFTCTGITPRDALTVRMRFDLLQAENTSCRWKQGLMDTLQVEIEEAKQGWLVRSITNCKTTEFLIAGVNLTLQCEGNELVFIVPEGNSALRVLILDPELGAQRDAAVKALPKPSPRFRQDHLAAAAAFWERSGLFLPQGPAAKVWTRSAYYLASAVSPLPTHIMEPTGLNNNIWKHGFPQDMYYVTENLARLGHIERALAQLPNWLDNLEAVKRYTRRIAEREGAFYPWIPPFEDWDGFEKDGPTNPDTYEFHNSAYVAAMVWNCFKITGDRAFLAKHFPILEEVARFYLSLTVLPPGGKAQIQHLHLRSQDEASTETGEKSNALCCFWSALYTLRAYQEVCRILGRQGELQGRVTEVLTVGYDLASLERPDGTLKTFAEDDRPVGLQKHPVQLNPICYLPLPDIIDSYAPVKTSWARRYDLTHQALLPISYGWTFGEFTLASARMRSGREVARDLSMVQPARFADPYWIQFYESSMREPWHMKKAYYFTTSGLYLQALTDCVVQYCRGTLDLFAAILPEWEDKSFFFHGLRTDGGLAVSGEWRAGGFRVEIVPSRDVVMPLRISRDLKGIRLLEADGQARQFDGQTEIPYSFRKAHQVVVERN